MIIQFTIVIIILSVISACSGYRILAIFPFNGRSHFHVLEPVAKALASRGHQVHVFSNFKLKEPFSNYTELEFPTMKSEATIEYQETISAELADDWMFESERRICSFLDHPTISRMIKNPPKDPAYDAIIVHMLTGYQCFNAIGYIWNVPVIGVVTAAPYVNYQNYIGNPLSLAIAPGHLSFYKQNLTFWERVWNVVKTYQEIQDTDKFLLRQEPLLKKYFGLDIPSHTVLEKNLALLLSNSHYSFHGIKPKTSALIEIGGINIKNDTSDLEPSLKKLVDNSDNGFIYFSFGTVTVLESLPQDVLIILYNVFRKLSPVKVIMRAPNPEAMPKNLSDNVYIFKWLPQQKILAHPNIRAFVTHGGGVSAQETIHYAVPVICIPLFADQRLNCDIFSLKILGVKIDSYTADQKDFDDAFQKVLSNPMYRESMKKFSKLYWDRPQSPREAVNYWVEYVIRHGKNILRSPTVDLEWWQYDLIDVYCFLFSCFTLLIFLTIIIIMHTTRLFMRLCVPMNVINSNKKLQ